MHIQLTLKCHMFSINANRFGLAVNDFIERIFKKRHLTRFTTITILPCKYIYIGKMYHRMVHVCTMCYTCLVHMNLPTTKFRLHYNVLSNCQEQVVLRSQNNKALSAGNVLHKLHYSSTKASIQSHDSALLRHIMHVHDFCM